MATYAIGDLQGCHDSLVALLAKIDAADPGATLIFAGDLVNRGPDSLATLRLVRSLGERAVAVLGNHDLHLLAVSQGIRPENRMDTLTGILQAHDGVELLEWMRRRPLAWRLPGHLVVHAGVLPQWSVEKTLSLAHEVETVLRDAEWAEFLRHMYGNTPARWNDALEGADRLRCIVNALTRMRFVEADGTMALNVKGEHGEAPEGCAAWYDLPRESAAEAVVVFGHWSARGLVMRPDVIGLDTGCVWGGKLTAVRLEDRALVQVECPRYQEHG